MVLAVARWQASITIQVEEASQTMLQTIQVPKSTPQVASVTMQEVEIVNIRKALIFLSNKASESKIYHEIQIES